MRMLATMLVAAAVLMGATEAYGQTTANATASITVPQLLWIDVTNTTVTFGSPDATAFNAGSTAATSGASVISTRGNVAHDVTVNTVGGATELAYTGSYADPMKPAADLEWSTNGSTWDGLTAAGGNVLTAMAAGLHGSAASVQYRMLLDWAADVPGSYSLAFVYTVVAN